MSWWLSRSFLWRYLRPFVVFICCIIDLFTNYVTNNTCLVFKIMLWQLIPNRFSQMCNLFKKLWLEVSSEVITKAIVSKRGKCCSWRNLWKSLSAQLSATVFLPRKIFLHFLTKFNSFLPSVPSQLFRRTCSFLLKNLTWQLVIPIPNVLFYIYGVTYTLFLFPLWPLNILRHLIGWKLKEI